MSMKFILQHLAQALVLAMGTVYSWVTRITFLKAENYLKILPVS